MFGIPGREWDRSGKLLLAAPATEPPIPPANPVQAERILLPACGTTPTDSSIVALRSFSRSSVFLRGIARLCVQLIDLAEQHLGFVEP